MTPATRPGWQDTAGHYLGDAWSALVQSPRAVHAFISAFTAHPDPAGSATRAGAIAAVIVILAVIITIVGGIRSMVRRALRST